MIQGQRIFVTGGAGFIGCTLIESKSKVLFKPALSADIALRIPSVDKAEVLPGFKAQVDMEDGILRKAESIRSA